MSSGIEGFAETDDLHKRLAALVVEVARRYGYSCRIGADGVELSGSGVSDWVLTLENLRRKVADKPRDEWPALVVDHMGAILSGITTETPLNTCYFERFDC